MINITSDTLQCSNTENHKQLRRKIYCKIFIVTLFEEYNLHVRNFRFIVFIAVLKIG